MEIFLTGLLILTGSGIPSLFSKKDSKIGGISVVVGNFAALVFCGISCLEGIIAGTTSTIVHTSSIPLCSINLRLDPLSSFFMLPLLVVTSLSALYGTGYMKGKKRNAGAFWFFFNLLTLSMLIVLTAGNCVLFIIAWELMTISSYFLVIFEHDKSEVRNAGWTYLVASHFGLIFIMALFFVFAAIAGSTDFENFAKCGAGDKVASVLFVFAVVGFGSKAGFIPLHIWLPKAHPAAPSHVSAVMSGIMIKLGIYGILRTLTFFNSLQPWWGMLMLGIGVSSGLIGVLFALAQHDLKKLLAYHSIENIGIIAIGIGLGIIGLTTGRPVITVLGLGGGILHVINHCAFKALLFFGAGTVIHETGTLEIDSLGGLMKKMPVTGISFLTGSAAISGLPPLNGFVSEFLIYLAAFYGLISSDMTLISASVLTIVSLVLVGGLAIACFSKVFGIVFLGEARSTHGSNAMDPGLAMRIPMIFLSITCVFIGIGAPFIISFLANPLSVLTGWEIEVVRFGLDMAYLPFLSISISGITILILILLFFIFRRLLPRSEETAETCTWDCGYAKPKARMQYTSSSYAQPITDFFRFILGIKSSLPKTDSVFPDKESFSSTTPDFLEKNFFLPVLRSIIRLSDMIKKLENGSIHMYILYIILTLVILLLWNHLYE